jgi:hypothetical protein
VPERNVMISAEHYLGGTSEVADSNEWAKVEVKRRRIHEQTAMLSVMSQVSTVPLSKHCEYRRRSSSIN